MPPLAVEAVRLNGKETSSLMLFIIDQKTEVRWQKSEVRRRKLEVTKLNDLMVDCGRQNGRNQNDLRITKHSNGPAANSQGLRLEIPGRVCS